MNRLHRWSPTDEMLLDDFAIRMDAFGLATTAGSFTVMRAGPVEDDETLDSLDPDGSRGEASGTGPNNVNESPAGFALK